MPARSLTLSVLVVAATLGGAGTLRGQAARNRMWDDTAAQTGASVWKRRQCYGCHELGRSQSTGPDLIGVTERRTTEWLRKWLKNPIEMTSEDSIGQALKKKYGSQMPNLELTDNDVNGLINYFARATWDYRNRNVK